MANGVQILVPGIVDPIQSPAVARVTANLRVTGTAGAVGLTTDVLSFASAAAVAGNWILGALRTTINGIPVVHQTSIGTAINPLGSPTSPVTVRQGDSRVSAS